MSKYETLEYETLESTSHAIVTVVLEVNVGSNWGGDCPLDQIYKQAIDDAVQELRKLLPNGGPVRLREIKEVKIVTTARKP